MKTCLLSFADYREPAERLAHCLDLPYAEISLHRFPDGESRVQLPVTNADHLLICRSLDNPNNKLIELMLTAATARDMGIKQLSLVAPYLCYMRQDIAFHAGEAVSQKIVGRYLAAQFDNIITVDPHLHRTSNLHEAVPCRQAISLSASNILGEFLVSHNRPYVLIGPDEESRQWVSEVAAVGGFRFEIATKSRLSDRQVEVILSDLNVRGADVILVDDMISTGHTLLEATKILYTQGAASVNCLVTHALHSQEVIEMLQAAGVDTIWSTDSILHDSNCIHLAKLLATGVKLLMDAQACRNHPIL